MVRSRVHHVYRVPITTTQKLPPLNDYFPVLGSPYFEREIREGKPEFEKWYDLSLHNGSFKKAPIRVGIRIDS